MFSWIFLLQNGWGRLKSEMHLVERQAYIYETRCEKWKLNSTLRSKTFSRYLYIFHFLYAKYLYSQPERITLSLYLNRCLKYIAMKTRIVRVWTTLISWFVDIDASNWRICYLPNKFVISTRCFTKHFSVKVTCYIHSHPRGKQH